MTREPTEIADHEAHTVYCTLSETQIALLAAEQPARALIEQGNKPKIIRPYPNWMRDLARQTRRNAYVRDIAYNLTDADLCYLTKRSAGQCEVSGIEFDFTLFGQGRRNPFRPSLDRVDSRGVYDRRNVRVVCAIANLAMNEWGEAPLRDLALAMAEKIVRGSGTP